MKFLLVRRLETRWEGGVVDVQVAGGRVASGLALPVLPRVKRWGRGAGVYLHLVQAAGCEAEINKQRDLKGVTNLTSPLLCVNLGSS